MSDEPQRRLTTIVAADIAGFSRLVGIDEEATLAAQRSHRSELIEPLLAKHHGRIANTAGDSFLLEFPSAVEAVRCSIAVQDGITERNQDVAANRRIEYRIGINVGDVVADGGDLLGDGVNIAARLENLCVPGGIILSDTAYQQVRDRLDVAWEDGGEHEVKNIVRPVQVWLWGTPAEVKNLPLKDDPLPLPDKPSIAVLPFDNLSGDPEQEYFADGITEDIITALSHLRNIFVIARNSTFIYKGTATSILEVAQALGVQYVIEGSVRKAGQRIRITVQLIDARRGVHIWADKFDRDLSDIFEIQDEITHRIAAVTETQLILSEGAHVMGHNVRDISLWEAMMRVKQLIYRFDQDSLDEALKIASETITRNPDAASPPAYAASCHFHLGLLGYSPSRREAMNTARELAQRSLELEEQDQYAHWIMCNILMSLAQADEAVVHGERALELNPNSSIALASLGDALTFAGRAEEGIPKLESAIRINPLDPSIFFRFAGMAVACYAVGRFEKAIEWADKTVQRRSDWLPAHLIAIASQARLKNTAGMKQAVNRFQVFAPDISASKAARWLPFKNPRETTQLANDLRKAGLPEE